MSAGESPAARPSRPRRADFLWYKALPTRWMDNDMYGHVNNVIYYSFFDTVIAHWMIEEAGFDPYNSPILDFVVDSGCRYHAPVAYPDVVHAGLRVGRLGTTSVRWEIGLFRNEDEDAAADGHFVHVFVDRATQRPVSIPAAIRGKLDGLLAPRR